MVVPLVLMTACGNVDFAGAAHAALQQHRCEQAEARGSCQRGWNAEYEAWRAQLDEYRQSAGSSKGQDPRATQAGYPLRSSPDTGGH